MFERIASIQAGSGHVVRASLMIDFLEVYSHVD